MKRLLLCAVPAALTVLAACSDSAGPAATGPRLAGQVLDTAGAPLADAALLLDFDLTQTPPPADKPRTAIRFSIPEPESYELTITDVCDDEVYLTVADSAVGTVTFYWDATDDAGRALSEGMFHVHLTVAGHEPTVREILLARNLGDGAGDFGQITCSAVHESWRLAARTGADGRFVVDRDCWEFGMSTDMRDENGDVIGRMTVAPRVRIWVYPRDGDRGFAGPWADFDPETGAWVEIRRGAALP